MMSDNNNGLYNNDRKRIFIGLVERKWKNMDQYQIRNMFEIVSEKERELDKDVSEWSKEEILDFLSEYDGTEDMLNLIRYTMRMYTSEMKAAGLTKSNNWDDISSDEIFSCVSSDLKSMYPTRDQLLQRIRVFTNYSDKFLLLGSFEGIGAYGVKNHEFLSAKLSEIDLEKKMITLHYNNEETRTIDISDELINIAIHAEQEYVYNQNETNIIWQNTPDYIVKRQRLKNSDIYQASPEDKYAVHLMRRISNAILLAGFPKRMKASDLRKAGCMDMVKKLLDQDVPRQEVLPRGSKYRDEIINKYGFQIVKFKNKFWRMYDEVY